MAFKYGLDSMTFDDAIAIASGKLSAEIQFSAVANISASEERVERIIESNEVVYGINTGFGPLCNTLIAPDQTKKLQKNILVSHSTGVGEAIPVETAKLMMILKLHSLARGYSGIRLETLQRINLHIANDLIPFVPKQGSVGASGDLAPLAHLFLPLIGKGKVWYQDRWLETEKALKIYGLEPIELGPKEGLALINGTQFISAFGVSVCERLRNALDNADIIAAMSLDSMQGSVKPFDQRLHNLRPHQGAVKVAARMRKLLNGSEILQNHLDCDRVQDPYSIRCVPQVHGTSRDAWAHLSNAVNTEINSVTDNPVIMEEGDAITGGNFHGQPLALPLDYACMAASEIGNISDRRIYLLLEGKNGLPKLLMEDTGINSGFMLAQYTSAALVSENKTLCFPASVDSIPTSLGQEDHVSMGSISGRKAMATVDNLEKIMSVELLCAAQAFDFRKPLKSSPILEKCHELVRSNISHAKKDRIFAEDLEKARELIADGSLVELTKEIDND